MRGVSSGCSHSQIHMALHRASSFTRKFVFAGTIASLRLLGSTGTGRSTRKEPLARMGGMTVIGDLCGSDSPRPTVCLAYSTFHPIILAIFLFAQEQRPHFFQAAESAGSRFSLPSKLQCELL